MIKLLKLYDANLQKVRLGNMYDGGYVVALQSIGNSSACFSYGVGTDISFEKSYVQATGNKAYCYDHTIENIHIEEKYKTSIIYTKEGISATPQAETDNFLNHYKKQNISGRVLFKADVEGAEYEFILNSDIAEIANITTGLVFEFHTIQDPSNREKFFACVEKLNKYYYLCHVHGNNYAKNFVYEELQQNGTLVKEYSIPEVIELTFVNKDLVEAEVYDTRSYPCDFLDRKNELSKQELNLDFLRII